MTRHFVLAILATLLSATAARAQTDTVEVSRWQEVGQRVDSIRRVIRAKADSNRYIHFADSLLDARDARARMKYDTTFIAVPRERWTLKARLNLSGNELITQGVSGGERTKTLLDAEHKLTLSFSVGYRGLTLGFALNPMKLAGRNKDFEYNLNSYGRKFGFDVVYTTANTFSGSMEKGTAKYDINSGDVRQRMASASAYYAFNHRRFSYPAAFSQSQIQLRSAGSWLVAASLTACRLNYDEHVGDATEATSIRYVDFGIGGGYGYNLVLGRWLLHGSFTSEVVAASWSRMKEGREETRMPYRFPNFIVQGRAAAIYRWRKYFAGFTAVSNFSYIGDKDKLAIDNVKWRSRAVVGFRF